MERAGASLDKVIGNVLHRVPSGESPLLAWPLACGSKVSDRTRASRFSQGVLYVEVADAGWQHELRSLAPRYLAAINKYSRERVERIEFIVSK